MREFDTGTYGRMCGQTMSGERGLKAVSTAAMRFMSQTSISLSIHNGIAAEFGILGDADSQAVAKGDRK